MFSGRQKKLWYTLVVLPAFCKPVVFVMVCIGCQAGALLASEPATSDKTLVFPFRSVSPTPQLAWISPAVQQSLLADLSSALPGSAAQVDNPAMGSDEAVKIAVQANARYAIFGSYQSIEGLLRLTGQVWDAQQNKSIAGLKVTGEARDIFTLEDELAVQIKRAVLQPRNDALANPSEHPGPTAADLAIKPSGPLQLSIAAEAPDAAITYSQPYVYSSQAAQAGDWRYVYGGSPTWSVYYGCGFGYFPSCGYGCGGSYWGIRCSPFSSGFASSASSFGRTGFSSPGRSFTSPNGGAGPVTSDHIRAGGHHR